MWLKGPLIAFSSAASSLLLTTRESSLQLSLTVSLSLSTAICTLARYRLIWSSPPPGARKTQTETELLLLLPKRERERERPAPEPDTVPTSTDYRLSLTTCRSQFGSDCAPLLSHTVRGTLQLTANTELVHKCTRRINGSSQSKNILPFLNSRFCFCWQRTPVTRAIFFQEKASSSLLIIIIPFILLSQKSVRTWVPRQHSHTALVHCVWVLLVWASNSCCFRLSTSPHLTFSLYRSQSLFPSEQTLFLDSLVDLNSSRFVGSWTRARETAQTEVELFYCLHTSSFTLSTPSKHSNAVHLLSCPFSCNINYSHYDYFVLEIIPSHLLSLTFHILHFLAQTSKAIV